MKLNTAIDLIVDELIAAEDKHPAWPTDAIHAAAILGEESGELTQAAIDFHYAGGFIQAAMKEAAQTGAMALRFLMNIEKYKRLP